MSHDDDLTLHLDGRDVVVSHPAKVLIPTANVRKRELVDHDMAVADQALRGAGDRPCVLVRYSDGLDGGYFF